MISRSENRLTRNGSTDARSSGPPRLNRTIGSWCSHGGSWSNRPGEDRPPCVGGRYRSKCMQMLRTNSRPSSVTSRLLRADLEEAVATGPPARPGQLELGPKYVGERRRRSCADDRAESDVEVAHQFGDDVTPNACRHRSARSRARSGSVPRRSPRSRWTASWRSARTRRRRRRSPDSRHRPCRSRGASCSP